MKNFIRKILLFSLLPLFYFGLNSLININNYRNYEIKLPNKRVLILGDSHPQKSLNPELFDSAINVSQTVEPYVLTFWKVKRILNTINPDTIIIGFAPHNISAYNDLKFSNEKWTHEIFKRIYPIEKFKEIDDDIIIDYSEFYKVLWKEIGFYPKENHIHFIGNYSNSERSNISNFESAIQRHYYFNENVELKISKIAINYLDSIIRTCNSKNIVPILVSSPVSKNYRENIPSNIWRKYEDLKNKYESSAIIIDKTDNYYVDTLFLDSDHLNSIGAEKFSREVIEKLKVKLY